MCIRDRAAGVVPPSTGASIHQCVWMHRCRHRVVACFPGSWALRPGVPRLLDQPWIHYVQRCLYKPPIFNRGPLILFAMGSRGITLDRYRLVSEIRQLSSTCNCNIITLFCVTISLKKTEYLLLQLRPGSVPTKPDVFVFVLNVVEKFCYLGSVLSSVVVSYKTWKSMTTSRGASVQPARHSADLNHLNHASGMNVVLAPCSTKIAVYQAIVIATLQ